MRWRRRTLLPGIAAATVLAAAPAYAGVDDLGLFEIDGNATNVVATPGDDWDQIYCADPETNDPARCAGIALPSANQLLQTFIVDKVNDATDDIFLNSNKDSDSPYRRILQGANDKNDIEHAYASVYRNPANGHLVVYFGLDMFATNGDAATGFWFLQQPIDNVLSGNDVARTPGDILVQSDFTNGGTTARVDVYTWGTNTGENYTQPSWNDLHRYAESSLCGAATEDPVACARTNTSAQPAPWYYLEKNGADPTLNFPVNAFFEGAVDLTAVFGENIPCFATFVAETRQSQSETAALEDLAGDGFRLCAIDVAKSAPEKGKKGDAVGYSVIITNSGVVDLTRVSINDSLAGNLLTYAGVTSNTCGATLAAGASCTITYDYTPNSTGTVTNTVTAVYSRGTSQVTDTDQADILLIAPTITLNKSSPQESPAIVYIYDPLSWTIELNNTSPAGTPTLSCVVTDPTLGYNSGAFDLMPGQSFSHTINDTNGYPTAGTYNNTASATCTPAGFTNTVSRSDTVRIDVLTRSPSVTIVKTGDTNGKVGDVVSYTVTITNNTAFGVNLLNIVDSIVGDLKTYGGVTSDTCGATLAGNASCQIRYTYTVGGADPDPLVNTAYLTYSDLVIPGDTTINDSHSVDLLHPAFSLSKSCLSSDPVPPGASVNFEVKLTNDSTDAPLSVTLSDPGSPIDGVVVALGVKGAVCVYDLDGSDGCYAREFAITAGDTDVTNSVTATATMAVPGQTFSNVIAPKNSSATCSVRPPEGATRTLGFWKTHGSDGTRFDTSPYGYTCHVFKRHDVKPADLGGGVVATSCADVFGIFWASPTQESDGSRRDKLCQAKAHGRIVLMAALLNLGLDNAATPPADAVENLRTALGGTDAKLITQYAGILNTQFNQAYHTVAIVDNDGTAINPADPNGTREKADIAFGDCN